MDSTFQSEELKVASVRSLNVRKKTFRGSKELQIEFARNFFIFPPHGGILGLKLEGKSVYYDLFVAQLTISHKREFLIFGLCVGIIYIGCRGTWNFDSLQ